MTDRIFRIEQPVGATWVDTTALNTGNVKADDGTSASVVSNGTGSHQASTTHVHTGVYSMHQTIPAASPTVCRLPVPTTAATSGSLSPYMYLAAAPVANWQGMVARSNGTPTGVFSVRVNTTGSFTVLDNTGTAFIDTATSSSVTGAVSFSGWTRMSMVFVINNASSTLVVKSFLGDSTTASGTVSLTTGINLGDPTLVSVNNLALGIPGATLASAFNVWWDDIQLRDVATEWAPYVVTGPPNLVVDETDFIYAVDARGSTAGSGGGLTYSITQTAGTSATATLITAGYWRIPKQSTSTSTWTVTVTESGSGLTDTQTVVVPTRSSSSGRRYWNGTAWA